MTDYSTVINKHLNKISAEMFMTDYHSAMTANGFSLFGPVGNIDNWNPTGKKSNQCEMYLFPKILRHQTDIEMRVDEIYGMEILITRYNDTLNVPAHSYSETNRFKVIASLEAWEQLNG